MSYGGCRCRACCDARYEREVARLKELSERERDQTVVPRPVEVAV